MVDMVQCTHHTELSIYLSSVIALLRSSARLVNYTQAPYAMHAQKTRVLCQDLCFAWLVHFVAPRILMKQAVVCTTKCQLLQLNKEHTVDAARPCVCLWTTYHREVWAHQLRGRCRLIAGLLLPCQRKSDRVVAANARVWCALHALSCGRWPASDCRLSLPAHLQAKSWAHCLPTAPDACSFLKHTI
jgi:hypothetical protein